jgi:CheY-like chemotaxis protein
MNLQGTSGLACLRKIKKTPIMDKIPVYIATSNVRESNTQVALDAGAVTWIKKPNQFKVTR